MVTIDDLQEFEQENEQDVINDCPYLFTTEQWLETGKLVYDLLNKEFDTEVIFDNDECWQESITDIWEVYQDTKGYDLILEGMCIVINKYELS